MPRLRRKTGTKIHGNFSNFCFSTSLLKYNSESVCWFALGLMVQLAGLEKGA